MSEEIVDMVRMGRLLKQVRQALTPTGPEAGYLSM